MLKLSFWTFVPPLILAIILYYLVTYEPCGPGNESCVWSTGIAFIIAAFGVGALAIINALRLLMAVLTKLGASKR